MTISTTAHMRAFCIVACIIGPALTGCQGAAAGETPSRETSGTPVTTTDPTIPADGANPPGTPAQDASDAASNSDATTPESPEAPESPETPSTPDVPSTPDAPAAPPVTSPATFPTSPLTVSKNKVVTLNSSAGQYFVVVPDAYDASHNYASSLFIWLHGCGGYAASDASVVSPGGKQSWITVSVGGRDGGCWTMETDSKLVLAALNDVKTRLNIDPRRVVIGGYSSGGNLAYRTAFYNAGTFAGILAENTAPFYGTNSSQSASIGAASWKFNVVHLAHTNDTTFKIATVRSETDALKTAGFPVTLLEQAGSHWDSDTSTSGTNHDLRTYLLPYLDAGWRSPE